MEIIVNAVLIKDFETIETFPIEVTDGKDSEGNIIKQANFVRVRKKLEFEKFQIICILKQMKDRGEIKSIWRPKNKKIQDKLNRLVKAKKTINNSIDKIREVFYKIHS